MATHTYVILSVLQQPSTQADPPVIISGTVDGVQVNPQTWLSIWTANGGNAIQAQNFCTSQMLAAFNAQQTPTPPNAPPGGTTITK